MNKQKDSKDKNIRYFLVLNIVTGLVSATVSVFLLALYLLFINPISYSASNLIFFFQVLAVTSLIFAIINSFCGAVVGLISGITINVIATKVKNNIQKEFQISSMCITVFLSILSNIVLLYYILIVSFVD